MASTETNTAGSPIASRGDAADRGLDVAMPRHVGIVHHDLAPAAQHAASGRLRIS